MIFEIDIWRSNKIQDDVSAWRANAREATQQDGCSEATLHEVFKEINRQGYDYVSILCWDASPDQISALRQRDAGGRPKNGRSLYSLINHGGDLAPSDPGNLIVTNPYRIDRSSAARHAEMWEQSKQHMQTKEGFVNARFFEATDAGAEYVFVSRAEWRSEELFMRQFAGRDFRQIVAPFEEMFSICFSKVIARVEQDAAQPA